MIHQILIPLHFVYDVSLLDKLPVTFALLFNAYLISSLFSFDVCVWQAAKIVKQVYSVIPVYEKVVPAILADGVWKLSETCSFSPGVPVGPMLAKPTKGVSEILDKFQDMEFTCEYKYDGERAQVYKYNLILINNFIQ